MSKAGLADLLSEHPQTSRGDLVPALSDRLGKGERKPRPSSRLLVLLAVIALVGALARLAWFLPAVQEWRLSRAPLALLLQERGTGSDNPRLLFHLGHKLNAAGRFAEAEPDLRRAVALDPDNFRLWDEWTRAQLGLGQTTNAFTQLKQWVGNHPDSGEAHLLMGKFYFAQNAFVRAHNEFTQATKLAPNNAEGWAYLSQTASQLVQPGTISQAGEALLPEPGQPLQAAQKAVDLAPDNARYELALADLLENDGQSAKAGQAYARAVELAPQNALIHQQYATWLLKNANTDADQAHAEAEARQAAQLDPKDGASALLLGKMLNKRGQAKDALPLLLTAAQTIDEPVIAKELSEAYQAVGDTTKAETWRATWLKRQAFVSKRDDLTHQIFRAPNSRLLHTELAKLLGENGDTEGSLRNYAIALRRPPDSAQAQVATGHDLLRGGYLDRAKVLAERALDISSQNPDAQELYGDVLLQTGHVDEAIFHFNYTTDALPARAPAIQSRVNAWVKAHPQPMPAHEKKYREALALANGQIGLRRVPPRALELAEQAVKEMPGNLEYLRLALRLEFGAKRTDDAIATARRIVRDRPDDAQTQALLGVLLANNADTLQEVTEAKTILDLVKNFPEVQAQYTYGMGLLSLREHDGKQATAYLKEAVRLDPDADVAYYKLAQAQQMSGQADAAAKTRAEYQARQTHKLQEYSLQGNVGQHPDQIAPYLKLIAFYERDGRTNDANALRAVVRARFKEQSAKSRSTDGAAKAAPVR